MRKIFAGISLSLATVVALPAVAFAHVVVTPAQAGVGARTDFSVSVPNEKQVDVTALKLEIPSGLDEVTPNVHAGWTINTVTDKSGNVTEIDWTGGTIPVGQRDVFGFRAQTPAQKSSLDWKAYQTYADGAIVSWDQKPSNDKSEGSNNGPYSVTEVVDDLSDSSTNSTAASSIDHANMWAYVISLAALALSVVALTRRRHRSQ